METRRMSHLVALAEERNFGKAAARVHLTQPAFSRSIQAAETEWGMKLFERGGTEVRCTAAGAFVVEKAKHLLQSARALERDVELYRDRQIGDLSFGIGPFPAATLLIPLLLDVRCKYPGIQVRVQVNNPIYALQHVRSEEHDFFVGDIRPTQDNPEFEVRRLGLLSGGLYVRKGHPLRDRRSVSMADVAPYKLALGRLPEEVQALLLRLMGRRPEEGLPVALECDDTTALKAVALATDTVMVGTPAIVKAEVAAGRLHPLEVRDLPPQASEVGVSSLRGRSLSPIAEYAVGFLGNYMAKAT
ncbi:LysR family transcriptional regulator [Caenimonas aquaedulcis]|uniref:LysR family transcriptional regulator n=1 Tax=Caenimonas aquaedulcis TaxID=2793270 RepID=A0A931MG90_9BURK|nr:LysR family transcriptional regulator [Caenimonas aquaedulcis]MBG9387827.1 LysR family transcriptional regulator [Caenimonas aquaedulcis]